VQLDIDNAPQPDALLRIVEQCGGSSRIDAEGYLVGPPELVAEIAASSSSIDLHDKLRAYRRNGVKEYLVWRTTEEERQIRDVKGLCRSVTLPRFGFECACASCAGWSFCAGNSQDGAKKPDASNVRFQTRGPQRCPASEMMRGILTRVEAGRPSYQPHCHCNGPDCRVLQPQWGEIFIATKSKETKAP
jgi:hypothetical protein